MVRDALMRGRRQLANAAIYLGFSIGGSALGYVFDELFGSFGHIFHAEK